MRIARRIPDRSVDPVEHPAQHRRALPEEAVEAAAELLGLDLARIGRAHRVDRGRAHQAAFQERQAAMELELVHGETLFSEIEPAQP
jgi:hypothetical protein